MGEGDYHDAKFDDMRIVAHFGDYADATREVGGHCMYSFNIYPTEELKESYNSMLPVVVTVAIAVSFLVMVLAFLAYDWFVQHRNHKVVGAAARSNALLSSLFPKNVRDQLVAEREQQEIKAGAKNQLKIVLEQQHDIA